MRAQFVGAEAEVQSVWRMQKKKKSACRSGLHENSPFYPGRTYRGTPSSYKSVALGVQNAGRNIMAVSIAADGRNRGGSVFVDSLE